MNNDVTRNPRPGPSEYCDEHDEPHFRTEPNEWDCYCQCWCPACADDWGDGYKSCICPDCPAEL